MTADRLQSISSRAIAGIFPYCSDSQNSVLMENTNFFYPVLSAEQSPLLQCLLHPCLTPLHSSSPPLEGEASSGHQQDTSFFQHPFLFTDAVCYMSFKSREAGSEITLANCSLSLWLLTSSLLANNETLTVMGGQGPAGGVLWQLNLCQNNSGILH